MRSRTRSDEINDPTIYSFCMPEKNNEIWIKKDLERAFGYTIESLEMIHQESDKRIKDYKKYLKKGLGSYPEQFLREHKQNYKVEIKKGLLAKVTTIFGKKNSGDEIFLKYYNQIKNNRAFLNSLKGVNLEFIHFLFLDFDTVKVSEVDKVFFLSLRYKKRENRPFKNLSISLFDVIEIVNPGFTKSGRDAIEKIINTNALIKKLINGIERTNDTSSFSGLMYTQPILEKAILDLAIFIAELKKEKDALISLGVKQVMEEGPKE
jgi:hypothetical protein